MRERDKHRELYWNISTDKEFTAFHGNLFPVETILIFQSFPYVEVKAAFCTIPQFVLVLPRSTVEIYPIRISNSGMIQTWRAALIAQLTG